MHGHVPAAARRLQPAGRLPAANRLNLAIGLPLHNREALTNLMQQIYDPSSANYHHYLTPEQFTEMFGPTKEEYQAVIAFAQANNLTVAGTHPNRLLVDINGTVADVERAFQVTMQVYQHPKEARTFYAPSVEPSVETGIPILDIDGLNNYIVPHPRIHRTNPVNTVITKAGSGPDGNGYMGKDFRAAYVPGVTNTGIGQSVALVEFDGYYPNDILMYERYAHLSNNTSITPVLLNGFDGVPTLGTNSGNGEVALDIEMAISMAPGISSVFVYEEGYPTDVNVEGLSTNAGVANILLNRIATDNLARQISCSWIVPINATSDQIFQQYAMQGQTFFDASGDDGAYIGDVPPPSDNPYLTQVGGTTLTTSGAGGPWSSETTWNYNDGFTASSGGVSDIYPIPAWQQGINMTGTKGSMTMRNFPDVAMIADEIFIVADNGQLESTGGTSCAAPLWAGFAALVNQQAADSGMPAIGFINPALYTIGMQSTYGSCFHDITTGNNFNDLCPSEFLAVPGYDLCTGLGTPIGSNLFKALLAPGEVLQIAPLSGFSAAGPVGGPFNITSQSYVLTNTGDSSLNWTNSKTASWLDVSMNNGTLTSGGTATVTVSLSSSATNLALGIYTASVWFTNQTSHLGQRRQYALQVGEPVAQNGDFETGDFSYWLLTGDDGMFNFVDDGSFTGIKPFSGKFFAALGQSNLPIATLSQTLPTLPGRYYSISFWLKNPDFGDGTIPNEFSVTWGGTTLFDQIDLPTNPNWSKMQFVVEATGPTTSLQFGFRNDRSWFGFDDISVSLLPETPPTVAFTSPKAGLNVTNAAFTVTGTANDNVGVTSLFYQLNGGSWVPVTTSNSWTNWSADVNLMPGTNIIRAYATDVSGYFSSTNAVSLFCVVKIPLMVNTNGNGTLSPNDNGALLTIGDNYTIKATASTGFKFASWTGSQTTTNPTLTFAMASNLTFTANFMDAAAPTLAIVSPKAGSNASNAAFTVTGTAKDNVGVVSVAYQLNGGSWVSATATNSWTNWNADVTLTPGTNTIKAYASDAAGNNSVTQSVSFFYAVPALLIVNTNGHGTVSPNENGALLDIGRSYTMKASAASGFKFTGWAGSQTTTNPTLTFLMASNLTFTANFMDATAPTLTITAPKAGLNVSNAAFTMTGTAKDNVGVNSVLFQLNGGSWQLATTSNGWTNWNAGVTLTPGTNIIKAYAADAAGNNSVTQSVSFFYVLNALLTVNTNGRGTVSPNDNGVSLEIGKSYTIKAAASTGFKFTGWTGSQTTTNASLTFLMESNLTFTANFIDFQNPTLSITAPSSGQKVTNAAFLVTGKASDNASIAGVYYEIDGQGWNLASTTNGWTNWTANVVLNPGTNVIQAYAVDNSGNDSAATSVKIDYAVAQDWAPDSVSGMTAQLTPIPGAVLSISFGTNSFSLTGTDTNLDNYGVGIYAYVKTGTNTAQLLATNTAPPTVASSSMSLNFTFTNADSGTFSNDVSGVAGTIKFANAPGFVPGSVRALTLTLMNVGGSLSVTLNGDMTFTTSENPPSSGNYTLVQYSPAAAMLQLNFTDAPDNGSVSYVELTFSSATAGAFFSTQCDNHSDPPSFSNGMFTLP